MLVLGGEVEPAMTEGGSPAGGAPATIAASPRGYAARLLDDGRGTTGRDLSEQAATLPPHYIHHTLTRGGPTSGGPPQEMRRTLRNELVEVLPDSPLLSAAQGPHAIQRDPSLVEAQQIDPIDKRVLI